MKNIKNFKIYTPSDEQLEEWKLPENAIFLISEDGQDWYQCQKTFAPDTLKVMYDQHNVICCSTVDVRFLTPEGFSVAEVEDTPEHRLANHTGEYSYIDGKVVPRVYSDEERRRMNSSTLNSLLDTAARQIAPLQDAVDVGRATEAQQALLLSWKHYRVDLLDVSQDLAKPDIKWPEPPAA